MDEGDAGGSEMIATPQSILKASGVVEAWESAHGACRGNAGRLWQAAATFLHIPFKGRINGV
jgi:hypothetical protein